MIKPTEAENNRDVGITVGFKKSEHNLKEMVGGVVCIQIKTKTAKILKNKMRRKEKLNPCWC